MRKRADVSSRVASGSSLAVVVWRLGARRRWGDGEHFLLACARMLFVADGRRVDVPSQIASGFVSDRVTRGLGARRC